MYVMLRAFVGTFTVLFAGIVLSAQTATEGNLLSVKKKGASDDQLIQLIHMSKKIDVDLSFENLSVLLDKGISQKVIDALIQRREELEGKGASQVPRIGTGQPAPSGTSSVPEPTAQGNLPTEGGVYLRTATGFSRLEEGTRDTAGVGMKQMYKPLIFKRVSNKFEFPGAESPFKVTSATAEFYIIGFNVAPGTVSVYELDRKKDKRELEFASAGFTGVSMAPKKDKRVSINAARVNSDVISVKIDGVRDGEYIFYLEGVPRFDFSVRASKGTTSNE